MEALGRFELPTCGLGNRRSIHLSYRATDTLYLRPRRWTGRLPVLFRSPQPSELYRHLFGAKAPNRAGLFLGYSQPSRLRRDWLMRLLQSCPDTNLFVKPALTRAGV